MGAFADGENDNKDKNSLPNVPPWPEMQMLKYEKDVLGFYVTKNPLSTHAEMLDAYSDVNTYKLGNKSQDSEVVIGGMAKKPRYIITKNGRNAGAKMAVFVLEDLHGTCEVVLFPKCLEKFADILEEDKVLFVKGKVDCKRETPNILCDELIQIEDVCDKLATKVRIYLRHGDVSEKSIKRISDICTAHRGKSPLQVSYTSKKGHKILAIADTKLNVRADMDFHKKMQAIVGTGKVRYIGK